MGLRAVLWGSIALTGALLAASAPWSRVLPSCSDVPAAERERARIAGRCEGSAPIVEARPGARGAVKYPRRPVPDLRGRPFNLHDERLGRFVVAVDYRPSAQRRDWVIDQVPRPPASLPEGGDLRVVLSDGGLVRVPDVRGSFARALALLYRSGLSWTAGDGVTGAVVGQAPAPGATVKAGTPITLRVAGPLALAPESTKPDVAPAPPPSTTPSRAPPSTVPSTSPPPVTAPAPGATPAPATAPPARAAMTMPDLQGLIFDVARQRLPGVNVERVHRAGAEAGGTVIGQSPPAGSALAPGTVVRLVLSDGSLTRVPRVRSFMIDEARQRLAPAELRPVITNVPSDAPAGTVVSQQPAEGQIAQRGSTVRLNVSSGPAAARAVIVPNLVGSTLERARAQLGRLQVERSERPAREPAGTVLEQTPAPGTSVAPGSAVSVVVSSGGRPEVIDIANVVGQNVDAATNALSEFRLERETVASVEPAGRVLAQDPAPGAPVPPGSTVRLRVSDGSLVVAPSLAKMTLGEARDAARAAGVALAPGVESRNASARVTAQQPAPGTPIARGAPLQLTLEERVLPFDVPPAVRDAWTRASGFALAQPSRNVAMAAVVLLALLALLALLLAARRREPRRWAPPVEPVLEPSPSSASDRDGTSLPPLSRRPASDRPATAMPRPASSESSRPVIAPSETASPGRPATAPLPGPTTETARRAVTPSPEAPASGRSSTASPVNEPQPSPGRSAPRKPADAAILKRREPAPPPAVDIPLNTQPVFEPPAAARPVATPPMESSPRAAPPVATPPTATPPRATPPIATPPIAAPPVATPPTAIPPVSASPSVTRLPVTPPPVVAPPVDPATITATARLDADPAKTVANNATPRGPEIRIAARLDAGDGQVRELPAEAAPHELTEETK